MKHLFKIPAAALLGVCLTLSLTACSSDDPDTPGSQNLTANEQQMEKIAAQYLANTVNTTYADLATSTGQLYDQLHALTAKFNNNPASVSQSEIDQVCQTFITARAHYEQSEAFLYGAATDFGIDPHIDTWPLDVDGLATALKNKGQLEVLSGIIGSTDEQDEAIAYAADKLGQGLLGFHGIEFVIFRNGKNRQLDDLKHNETHEVFVKAGTEISGKEELVFATAVAGDLRDRCWQMEVAWNENAPKAHFERVEQIEQPTTMRSGNKSYGQDMLGATKPGSTYATWQEVMTTICKAGCENICNEVANTKIGNPYSGADKNYIESPYSERSFYDFEDNIISIGNSIYGGREGQRDEALSIMHFLKLNHPQLHATIDADYKAAITALKTCQALPGGFVKNIQHAQVGVAQKAIQKLDEDLNAAAEYFAKVK